MAERAKLAAEAFYNINPRFLMVEKDFEGYIVVADVDNDDICIVNAVELKRPMSSSKEGMISQQEFERLIDKYIDTHEDVDMFFRFDIVHVYVTRKNRAMLRLHCNAPFYDEKEVVSYVDVR